MLRVLVDSAGMVTVIAHRGASAHAPENAVPALDLALEQGADVLEVDVRLTADGVPVLLHDETLLRTAGDPRPVATLRAAELDALPAGLRPLRLDETLVRYGHRTRLLLDLKDPRRGLAEAVVDCVHRCRVTRRVQVQAFGRPGLRLVREADLSLELAQLYPVLMTSRMIRRDLSRVAAVAGAIGPEAGSVDAALVAAAHRHGLRVQPYTVNHPGEIERLLALGVDGLITDVPDRVAAARRPVELVT